MSDNTMTDQALDWAERYGAVLEENERLNRHICALEETTMSKMILSDQPWKTWIGHGLQGIAVGLVFYLVIGPEAGLIGSALALLYHFAVREYPEMRAAFGQRNRARMWDSLLDFVSPFVGWMFIYLILP